MWLLGKVIPQHSWLGGRRYSLVDQDRKRRSNCSQNGLTWLRNEKEMLTGESQLNGDILTSWRWALPARPGAFMIIWIAHTFFILFYFIFGLKCGDSEKKILSTGTDWRKLWRKKWNSLGSKLLRWTVSVVMELRHSLAFFNTVSGVTILSTELHQIWVKVKSNRNILWFVGWNPLLWVPPHHDCPWAESVTKTLEFATKVCTAFDVTKSIFSQPLSLDTYNGPRRYIGCGCKIYLMSGKPELDSKTTHPLECELPEGKNFWLFGSCCIIPQNSVWPRKWTR